MTEAMTDETREEKDHAAAFKNAPVQGPAAAAAASNPPEVREDVAAALQGLALPKRPDFRASGDTPQPRGVPPAPGAPIEQAPAPKPTTPAPAAQIPPAAPPQGEAGGVVALHTLKDDLQTVVRDKKISFIRAAALEQQKLHRDAPAETKAQPAARGSKRTVGVIVLAALLILLGGAALAAVLAIEKRQGEDGTSGTLRNNDSLLFAEQTAGFPIAGQKPDDLKRIVAQARAPSGMALGSIVRLVPLITEETPDGTIDRPATLQEFLTAIGAHAPDELIRAVHPDFFFGVHAVDENAPLMVLTVDSYEHAFAGMLAWEKTMNADLAPIFTPLPAQRIDERGLLAERSFVDAIMRNYDVRALKDDAGEIQLYYSFPTRGILIIAESPYSFTEALSRLRADRRL